VVARDEKQAQCGRHGHYRHSGTRLQLVKRMSEWSDRYGFSPLVVPSPRYEDEPLPDRQSSDCTSAVELADRRLKRLADELPELPRHGGAHVMLEDIASWQARLQALDLTGDDQQRYFLAKVCDCHAGLWQLLEEWFAPRPGAEDDGQRRVFDEQAAVNFAAQVLDARQLWRTAYAWWRPRDVLRALPRHEHDGGVPPIRVLYWTAADWWRERRSPRGSANETVASGQAPRRSDRPSG
jgi:hypothetical protein